MRRLGAGSPGQELTSGPQDCRSCAPAATPASGLAERAARHYARVPTVTLLCIVVHAQTTNRHFAGEVGRSVGAILTTGRARTQPVGAALGCGISAVAAVQIGVFCVCRWPGTCAMVGAVQGRLGRDVTASLGKTQREDPPPLFADLDCAVRGSGPLLRVCMGSSVMVIAPLAGARAGVGLPGPGPFGPCGADCAGPAAAGLDVGVAMPLIRHARMTGWPWWGVIAAGAGHEAQARVPGAPAPDAGKGARPGLRAQGVL